MYNEYTGKKMKFIGASDAQANYAGNADPRDFFNVGDQLSVKNAEIRSFTTVIEFDGFPDKTFNSVCFDFC